MPMNYDGAQNPVHRWQEHYQHVTSTVGMFTHADGSYSLIDVRRDSVWAAGITFTIIGQALLEEYKDKYNSKSNQPDEIGGITPQIMEETYIMSQALYYSSFIKIADFDPEVENTPFMWGWHFNWNGSKAAIVTKTNNTVEPAGAITYHIDQSWKLYEVTISEDSDGILSASLSLEEDAKSEINNGDLRVWIPNNIGGQMSVIPYLGCNEFGVDGYGEGDFNVPLYCMYKPNGDLRVVRFYRYWIGEGDHDHHVDLADDVNCPDRGWQLSSPGTLTGNYTGRLLTSVQGFEVDGVKMEATQGNGYTRNRYYSRQLNGVTDCNPKSGWHDPQIQTWTKSDFEMDCDRSHDCCCSGPLFATTEVEIEYEEWLSSVGSPDIGQTQHIFALIINGRSTESVSLLTWQQTYHTMTYRHQYSYGHDDVKQASRINGYDCGEPYLTPTEHFYTPASGCGEGASMYIALGGWYTSSGSPGEDSSSVTSSYKFETNAYIVNPYEIEQTDNLVAYYDGAPNPYWQYFRPAICNAITYENLWSDIRSFCGRSIRSESSGGLTSGSNCELGTDLPGVNGYWAGWS